MTNTLLQKQVLILGASGNLSQAFQKYLKVDGLVVGRDQVDFEDPDALFKLDRLVQDKDSIEFIINTVAYNNVDLAERDRMTALRVNAEFVSELAAYCFQKKIKLIHYSTDYVFDGKGVSPRFENDNEGFLNYYGQTKWLGEQAIIKSGCEAMIFRTSWLYSDHGHSFLKTMLKLFQTKEEITVVSDQVGSPTYAKDLALYSLEAIKNYKSGLYHLTNDGFASWYEFSNEIYRLAQEYGFELKTKNIQ
jgi:dTDP-4-dehydrorhamnose reductase